MRATNSARRAAASSEGPIRHHDSRAWASYPTIPASRAHATAARAAADSSVGPARDPMELDVRQVERHVVVAADGLAAAGLVEQHRRRVRLAAERPRPRQSGEGPGPVAEEITFGQKPARVLEDPGGTPGAALTQEDLAQDDPEDGGRVEQPVVERHAAEPLRQSAGRFELASM